MDPTQPKTEEEKRREEEERTNALLERFKAEQAKRDAEAQAKREEAERRRRAEEEERIAQEHAIAEALQLRRYEEDARKKLEEQRRLEEEARLRDEAQIRAREQAEQARIDAEAAALKAARAKAAAAALREKVAAHIRAIEIPPGSVRIRRMVVIFVVLLIGALATINFIPIDASSFESTATVRLGTPVKIGRAHLSTAPLPMLRFENVLIGPQGEVRITTVRVKAGLRTIIDEKKHFGLIEAEGVQAPLSWFAAAIGGKPQSDTLHVERVVANDVTLLAEGVELPKFKIDAEFDRAGSLQSLLAETADRQQTFSIEKKYGKAEIRYSAKPFKLPFPGPFRLDDFVGSGTFTASELIVHRFDATIMEGALTGKARLRWDPQWALEADFTARSLDPGRMIGTLVPTGRLDGTGTLSMRAATPEKLQEAMRVDGSFTVHRGTLGFIDLTRALQGSGGRGGSTTFTRLDGNATYAGGIVQVRQMRLEAGLLNATGEAAVDSGKNLAAKFQVNLSSARTAVALGGTVTKPEIKR